MSADTELGTRVGKGLAWSLANGLVLRLGTFVVGIALARILAPEDFGVFAIALTVQTILMNLADLGLAADLVRHGDLPTRGPTIATLSAVSSSVLALTMAVSAGAVTTALGSSDATGAVRLMAVTILFAGIGVVPYAHLQREFMQKQLFLIESASFVIFTTLSVTLAVAGMGALALAIARVVSQAVATCLQFRLSRQPLRFGWDADIARSGIRFGLPLACAGLLALTLLNLDYVLVGHAAGVVTLGFYVLAFNISSWPTTLVGSAIRAVAMPAFAHRERSLGARDHQGVVAATGLTLAVALPVGAALTVMATQTIEVVYGSRWLPAASALAGLAVFGVLRVVFDLWVAFLTSCGDSVALLWTQAMWIVVLGPVMYVAIRLEGLRGAGWSHALVAAGVMLPLYLVAMRRVGVPARDLLRSFVPSIIAILPATAAGWFVSDHIGPPFLAVLGGGTALLACYGALIWPWLRRQPAAKSLRRPRRRAQHEPRTSYSEGAS
ncbi:oligosaccharide flippase family protein [Aeromicrobium chenweiae]|uniref:Uncharacterized protein n=1 Tax=Aeromicrobium chenweiae TaxID=2079793 RepID=A0A2S0WJG9_9ACTN|nr:oligosaccharide flippase family protein [Aeromicrobium chenweiae]AWB91434.1 hypothetical protein C3E78_03920 [Aeromicrobium chenweiae]TGN30635.1 hypothetical protein E4L97_16215 [Aeromicrobium chenweiae]